MYNLYAQRDTLYGDDNHMLLKSFSSRSQAESYINKRWPGAIKDKDENGNVSWLVRIHGNSSLYELYISSL